MSKLLFCFLFALVLFSLQASAATCFGVQDSDPTVCSSHGNCTAQDTCECFVGYQGTNCSLPACGWESSQTLGAPSPTVTVTVDSNLYVIVKATFARRYKVSTVAAFFEVPDCTSASTLAETYQQTWTLIETTSCYETYQFNRTLHAHVNDENTTKIYGDGDVFDVQATVYASYMDTDVPSGASCKLTTFRTPFTIRTYLQGVAFAGFTSTNQPVGTLAQNRIRVDPNSGHLAIYATLTAMTEGSLTDFRFNTSSNGITMNITSTSLNSPCGGASQPGCQYSLLIMSQDSVTDYSGTYTFKANLITATQNVVVDIIFNLKYLSPVPPPVNNVNLTTAITFHDANYENAKNSYSDLDSVWVLSSITQQINIPSRKLSVRDAWICCMRDRAPMPADGCATQTAEMNAWAQLVNNEVPTVQQWNVAIQPLPFADTKAGFSFSALPLTGEDRLCYLHVVTFLKQKTRKLQQTPNTLIAYGPLNVVSRRSADPKKPETSVVVNAAAQSASPVVVVLIMFIGVLLMLQ